MTLCEQVFSQKRREKPILSQVLSTVQPLLMGTFQFLSFFAESFAA